MDRFGSAHWNGDIGHGHGTVSTQSGAVDQLRYAFLTRFGEQPGTNPEELIGAAHAACFAMALSNALTAAGFIPDSLDTKSIVTIEKDGPSFSIKGIHLSVSAAVPGIDRQSFLKIAEEARVGCPVSRVFKAPITFEVTF
ncbi:Peroxiredoxin OsmC [Starkeya nomas]|uniref:Peroxiredoxin OsmC n=1 Tax=Starkeya nomas TaxID=2666134 RepID=A0A5S9NKD5_9HYPH|nr:OsmC family peroxiredoxin [Starkeya nomas]CAA0090335.1 Peroxiredoxin OsmC [Starkeya nomas]